MKAQDGIITADDPRQLGDWNILARLGAGGMGVVYLGERGNERAAIKTIRDDLLRDESFKKRFEREAGAMSAADSPRVAKVLEADIESSPPYIAFRFYDGPNLRDVVKEGGPLDAAALRALAVGLAEGLSAIHDQGIVHRDIKPSNIIMTLRGPVIIDFGIASYHSSELTQLTVTGEPIGSPTWMSPEYITTGFAAEPGDVFGWASTLQFAATGMPPFGIGAPQPLLYRITNVEPTPHDIAGPLGMLISQSLAKNPANRPTVAELLHTLEVTDGKRLAPAATVSPRPAIGDPPTTPPRTAPRTAPPPPSLPPPYPSPPIDSLPRAVGRSVGRHPRIWRFVLTFATILFLFAIVSSARSPGSTITSSGGVPTPAPVQVGYPISTAPGIKIVAIPTPAIDVPPPPDAPIPMAPATPWPLPQPSPTTVPPPTPGFERLDEIVTGPAVILANPNIPIDQHPTIPLFRQPSHESRVVGELRPGDAVTVHDEGLRFNNLPYVYVTTAEQAGFVNQLDLDYPE